MNEQVISFKHVNIGQMETMQVITENGILAKVRAI